MAEENIQRIIMSKRVASKYIDSISEVGHTLTVYFSDDRSMTSFITGVKNSSISSKVSVSEGFDRATFVSTDEQAIDEISDRADQSGFDSTT